MELHRSVGFLHEGDPVEVVTHFTGGWAGGFEVAAVGAVDCRVRRVCDGEILPVAFRYDEVRALSTPRAHERPHDDGLPDDGGSVPPLVLRLPTELDIATVEAIRSSVIDAVDHARAEVIVDLDDVHFLDTYGIRLLVTIRRRAWERDLPFGLRGGKPLVRALLELVGQDPYFYPDVTELAPHEPSAAP
jgi:anti-anti-sigma factor